MCGKTSLRYKNEINMSIQKINLQEKLESVHDYWSPKIVGELNRQHVKIAKLKGDFVMHQHDHEDELFM